MPRDVVYLLLGAVFVLTGCVFGCGGGRISSSSSPPPESLTPGSVSVRLTAQATGVTASLRGVAVRDERTVWASGSEGTVLRSLDGGATWERIAVGGGDGLDFRDIELLGQGTVLLMSAGPEEASRIYKSRDRGENWRLVHASSEEGAFFNGMAFWDEQNGVLTGDPVDGRLYLLVTRDGGDSWQRTDAESLPEFLDGEYGFAASGTGVATHGRSRVWIATGGAAARIFSSNDRGRTWSVYPTPVASGTASSGVFSIAFRDDMLGVAVGGDYQEPELDRGNAAWTADGGRSWTLADTGSGLTHKACVRHLGDGRYLAAGRVGLAFSEDDGRRWQAFDAEPYYAFDYHAASSVGWLVGSDGRIARFVALHSSP